MSLQNTAPSSKEKQIFNREDFWRSSYLPNATSQLAAHISNAYHGEARPLHFNFPALPFFPPLSISSG